MFTVASARLVVVRVSAGVWLPEMVSVSDAFAVSGVEYESVTTKANKYVPPPDGVPVMAPAADRVKPGGRLPELSAQVYGGTPPEASSVVDG